MSWKQSMTIFFREDVEKLELKGTVGYGAWGSVRKAELKKLGDGNEFKVCAVKEFTSQTFKKEDFPEHWEISIIKKLNHMNIVILAIPIFKLGKNCLKRV